MSQQCCLRINMSKSLLDLHPIVKAQYDTLLKLAKYRFNLNIICTNTLRSEAEQNALYAQGRNPLSTVNQMRAVAIMSAISENENKRIVTNAKSANTSWHGFGLAFDIAVVDGTGRLIKWDKTSDWNADGIDDWAQVGSLASEIGLEWGGNFTSIYDAPHYQNRLGMTIQQAREWKNAKTG